MEKYLYVRGYLIDLLGKERALQIHKETELIKTI